MISKETLEKIAAKRQTSFLNVMREYGQLVFLSSFYQLTGSEEIYFKGGTALRLLHGNPRYSEDLDFTASQLASCHKYEDLLQEVLAILSSEGFVVELQESKSTSGGCLAIFNLRVYDARFPLRTDVSLRKNNIQSELILATNELYPPFTVTALPIEDLAKEKLRALFERQKGRDFFDIYYLLREGSARLVIARQKDKLTALLKEQDQAMFSELEPFLPQSQKSIIRSFPQMLNSELERL